MPSLVVRRQITTRSNAALVKRVWRERQRAWGAGRELGDMTEHQIWCMVRILVLLLNIRDMTTARRGLTHARALGRRLGWSQGVLMPRLQRLESLEWVRTEVAKKMVAGKRVTVQSYLITSKGEAVAVVMSEYLQSLVRITPHERRKV